MMINNSDQLTNLSGNARKLWIIFNSCMIKKGSKQAMAYEPVHCIYVTSEMMPNEAILVNSTTVS